MEEKKPPSLFEQFSSFMEHDTRGEEVTCVHFDNNLPYFTNKIIYHMIIDTYLRNSKYWFTNSIIQNKTSM